MIKFIVDSGSDILPLELDKYNIDILPLIVELDGKSYRPYWDITGEQFRELLKNTKGFPKTASVSSSEIADRLRPHIQNGDEVIMVMMSKKGSGTFNYIHIAKKQLEEEFGRSLPISAVDSMNYSIGYMHPIYDAIKMADMGKGRVEIIDFLNKAYEKQKLIFMMTDLSYLKRGGRIKASSAFLGGLLGVIPLLHIKDGLVEPFAKARGIKQASDTIISTIKENCPSMKLERCQIVQCSREKEAYQLESLMKQHFDIKEFLPMKSPEASITSHAGTDFIGVAFQEE